MKLKDYSPPESPTPDEQRDALQKGLGRAVYWAKNGKLSHSALLDAVLHDLRFDRQCEDMRSDWLHELIQAAGAVELIREPLLLAMRHVSDEAYLCQTIEIGGFYARAGDHRFKNRLYELVRDCPVDCEEGALTAEEQLIKLDGMEGFLFGIEYRGIRLQTRAWNWDDSALMNHGVEQFGREKLADGLKNHASENIQLFYERWLAEEQPKAAGESQETYTEQLLKKSVSDIFEAIRNRERRWLRGWGMKTSEENLLPVLDELLKTTDPGTIELLLKVFSNRAMPRFDEQILTLLRHEDEKVHRSAYTAVAMIQNPMIREFAVLQLNNQHFDRAVYSLFIRNYCPGDERLILDSLVLPMDRAELHWMLMDISKIFEDKSSSVFIELAIIAYFETPCELCRYRDAEFLLQQNALPTWLSDELKNDSNEDTRKLSSLRLRN